MSFRSIGFLPLLMTIALGSLFFLKFHRAAKLTEHSLRLEALIDESSFDGATTWPARRQRYFEALFVLDDARTARVDLEKLLEEATGKLDLPPVYRPALAASLLHNLGIADEFELLTEENRERLKSGERLKISAGGYRGELAVLDNTVPHRYSPELEMRFANLLLKPESVWRRHPDEIGEDAMRVISACRGAELMTETSYARALEALRRAGKY